ncbi:MAG: discoidin domain-containing protein [Lentisphaeria bacterium]|nr:discoidin domain-containing protein [Lentisphaeria bacterium]
MTFPQESAKSVLASRICLAGLLGALSCAAQMYEIRTNSPARVTLPLPASGVVRVSVRTGETKWRPLKITPKNGCIALDVDPAKLGTSCMLLFVNPPKDLDLNDTTSPSLESFHVDGVLVKMVDEVWAGGKRESAPKKLVWEFVDGENRLAADDAVVTIDGRRASKQELKVEQLGASKLRVIYTPGDFEYGNHEVVARVSDVAPTANQAVARAKFEVYDSSNVILAPPGVEKLTVDSHYDTYPDLTPITDGVRTLPGAGAGNDVCWASAETEAPHWIDIKMKKPVKFGEVTLHWPRLSGASRKIEVQVRKGDGWKTIGTSPKEGLAERLNATVRFAPVTTSRFRILQPVGGGSAGRPNLMWVMEVEAR